MTSNTSRAPKSSAAAVEPERLPAEDTSTVPATTENASPDVQGVNVEPALDTLASTPAATPSAAPVEDVDPRKVDIRLANPLDKPEDLRRLGLEPKEGGYKPLDTVRVSRDHARVLITAGYAHKVDPEDQAAVEAALTPVEQSA